MMTAAATTAPHVGATPTSSTPATRVRPSFQRRRSWRRVGTMTAIELQGSPSRRRRIERPRRSGAINVASVAASAIRAAFPERRGLADSLPQEVQLRPSHLAVADDLDLLDPRAVDLERPLNADPARDPANRDRAGDPTAAQAHDSALEDLDPLAVPLDDLGRDLDGIARRDLREIRSELVGDDLVEDGHEAILFFRRQREAADWR